MRARAPTLRIENEQSEVAKLFGDGGGGERAWDDDGLANCGGEGEGGALTPARFLAAARERFYLQDRDEAIRNAFRAFDANGDGFISRQACLTAFAAHAGFVPRHVVDLIFDELDIDGDGKVSYRDFVSVWNNDTHAMFHRLHGRPANKHQHHHL